MTDKQRNFVANIDDYNLSKRRENKMKVKLRDMTDEQKGIFCRQNPHCTKCQLFQSTFDKTCAFDIIRDYKSVLSDKFLDQEVEIKEK